MDLVTSSEAALENDNNKKEKSKYFKSDLAFLLLGIVW